MQAEQDGDADNVQGKHDCSQPQPRTVLIQRSDYLAYFVGLVKAQPGSLQDEYRTSE